MNRLRKILLAVLPLACAAAWAATAPQTVVFKGATSEHKWELRTLNPELPSDWTGFNYLVLELKASSPQRFALVLHSGPQSQRRTLQPLPNVWIRAAVPLQYFRQPNRSGSSLASVGKVPRASFWMSTGGSYGPLNAVTAIGVSMQQPLGEPTLEVRAVRLSREDPGSDVLAPKPVVDEFGQWIPAEWPGKVHTLAQLKADWSAEARQLAGGGDPGRSRFGGYAGPKVKATGFFRVQEVDGRWWFIDPEGCLFFSTSCTGVGFGSGDARVKGREDYFTVLPSESAAGRRLGGFYARNLARRHGDDFERSAIDFGLRRLEAWGFNTLGNWSDSAFFTPARIAYQLNVGDWGMRNGFLGMPDVYAEEFVQNADREAAAACAPRRNDPWLLGYFVGNEPPWAGRESLVVDVILDARKPSAIQREARAFLAGGDTPERRKQFVYRAFERFLEVTIAAIRRHDPNHLILGFRFGGGLPPADMLRACRVFDVYSTNVYAGEVSRKNLEEIYRVIGRPILIGEFHFGVPGRGLAAGLVQVRDFAERGVAYRHYVEQAAAFPALIGTSWFQWVDQPCTGRMDGENYNIGLVDVTDRPYADLIAAAQATHRRLLEVHAGKTPPFSAKLRAQ